MGKKAVTVLPSTERILNTMGEQIKLARYVDNYLPNLLPKGQE